VETTGVDFRKHSIIQLAGLVEIENKVVEGFNYQIKPHPKAKIEPKALSVNGTTEEEIMQYPEMSQQLTALKALLGRYIDPFNPKQKAHLVGYNNRYFDDPFLRKYFELCGDAFIGSWFWADTIDVLCLASEFLADQRTEMPSFKLTRVAKHLGLKVDDAQAHDALYDVRLTRQVYQIVTGRDLAPNHELY
jgi:DNA polymerase-3 subunit epsilon